MMKMRLHGGAVGVWAGAAGTMVSAVLYLFDFATNLSTLRAYYRYEYECPYAPLASPLLRDDPVCNAIHSGFQLHNFGLVFGACLLLLVLAHLAYAIIFWFTLDPSKHPLRLAYFLPLIHFYRLLKVLLHSFSTDRLKELQKSQKELCGLYDALGVALETAPQFAIQLTITLNLGQYIKGSSDPTEQAQKIPTTLMLSLIASIISGAYGASMAGFYVMEKRMSLFKRAFMSIMLGVQALVAMLAKGMSTSSIFQVSEPRLPIPLAMVLIIQLILAWIFSGLIVHVHYHDHQGISIWLKVAHSLGMALMTRITGPMYILIKLKKSSGMFLWGTFLHIVGEMFCLGSVLVWPHYGERSPCPVSHIEGTNNLGSKYSTCKLFTGVIVSSYFILLLTTILVIKVCIKHVKKETLLRRVPEDMQQGNHNVSTSSSIVAKMATTTSNKGVPQSRMSTPFEYFIFLLTMLCIRMLHKKYSLP